MQRANPQRPWDRTIVDYQVKIVQTPTHLHAIGEGSHTEDALRQFLTDAHRAAMERKCDALLLEQRFSGPSLAFASIYSIICERKGDGTCYKRIALVDTNDEHDPERAEFAEMAANKLGVNVRVFASPVEAGRWLERAAQSPSPEQAGTTAY